MIARSSLRRTLGNVKLLHCFGLCEAFAHPESMYEIRPKMRLRRRRLSSGVKRRDALFDVRDLVHRFALEHIRQLGARQVHDQLGD
jgi:hypothetical protein